MHRRSAPLRLSALPMLARSVSAIVGGYLTASLLAALLARLLPVARVEAVTWGLVLSFAFYAALLLWTFVARSIVAVLVAIWGGSALLAAALFLVRAA